MTHDGGKGVANRVSGFRDCGWLAGRRRARVGEELRTDRIGSNEWLIERACSSGNYHNTSLGDTSIIPSRSLIGCGPKVEQFTTMNELGEADYCRR